MAVLIDTDLLVEHTQWPVEELVGDEEWAMSVVTVSELLHGVFRATGVRRAQRRAMAEQILAGAEALPITTPVARVHAELGVRPREVVDALEWRLPAEGAVSSEAIVGIERCR